MEDASLQEPEPEPEAEGPRRPKRPSWMKPEEPEEPMPDVLAALGLDEAETAPGAAVEGLDEEDAEGAGEQDTEGPGEQVPEAPEVLRDEEPDEEPVNRADEGAAQA